MKSTRCASVANEFLSQILLDNINRNSGVRIPIRSFCADIEKLTLERELKAL